MLTIVVSTLQLLCVALVLSGGILCLIGRDRRNGHREPVNSERLRRRSDKETAKAVVIVLADASRERATDFEIGYRRVPNGMKRAA